MLKHHAITDSRTVGLLVVMVALGVFLSLFLEKFGVLAWVAIALLPIAVCVFPSWLRQAVLRFQLLRTHFTWWHWLWLLVFLSGCQFRLRDSLAIQQEAVDAGAAYRIGVMAIAAFGLGLHLVLRRPPLARLFPVGVIRVLAIYGLICTLSTFWSVYPAWTLYKSLEYLVDVALIAAILATISSAESYKCLFDWTWAMDGLLLLSVWIGVLIWPAEAFRPQVALVSVQLQGVLPQIDSNGVGHLAAVLSIVCVSRLLLRERNRNSLIFYGLVLALGLATMALSQTRSAILGFCVGLALLLYFSKSVRAMGLLAAAVIVLLLLTSTGPLAQEYFRRGQDPDMLGSLSGRTDWWEAGWEAFLKTPWVGTGAHTARFTVLAKMGSKDASSMHNTYLETLLGVGILGLIPLVAVFLWTWSLLIGGLRHLSRNPAHRFLVIEAVAVFGVITFRSFFSTTVTVHPDLEALAVLGYAEVLQRCWKQQESVYRVSRVRPKGMLAGSPTVFSHDNASTL